LIEPTDPDDPCEDMPTGNSSFLGAIRKPQHDAGD
jgi:hypothetical protein